MSVFLYIETNGIMSLAQKRNPAIESLVENSPDDYDVRLILPSICYMEALFAFQQDLKRRNEFNQSLAIEINEAKRSNLLISQLAMNDLERSQVKYNLLSQQLNDEFGFESFRISSDFDPSSTGYLAQNLGRVKIE